jgi:hypothetical protein
MSKKTRQHNPQTKEITTMPISEPAATEAAPVETVAVAPVEVIDAPFEVVSSAPVTLLPAPAEAAAPDADDLPPSSLMNNGVPSGIRASANVAPGYDVSLAEVNAARARDIDKMIANPGGVQQRQAPPSIRSGGYGGLRVTSDGEVEVTSGDGRIFDDSLTDASDDRIDIPGAVRALRAEYDRLVNELSTVERYDSKTGAPILRNPEGSQQRHALELALKQHLATMAYQNEQFERIQASRAAKEAARQQEEADDRDYQIGRQQFINLGQNAAEMKARSEAFDKAALERKAQAALEVIASRQAARRRG